MPFENARKIAARGLAGQQVFSQAGEAYPNRSRSGDPDAGCRMPVIRERMCGTMAQTDKNFERLRPSPLAKGITMARHRPTQNYYTRPAIFALERLHAELGRAILENRDKHDELSGQMRQVEAVIKMLDPNYSLIGIAAKRRKPNKRFKRGTLIDAPWTRSRRRRSP
ncbi:hypothetical protein [Bradyrhizobium liaoningense]